MAGQEISQVFHMHYSDSLDDKNFALHGRGMALLLTLLCILLFLTLMYLYFRWACSTYPTAITTTTIGASSATTSRPERNIDDSLGLDTEGINSILVSLYEGGEPTECAICLGRLKKGEKVKVLPICRHVFHSVCIDKWLRTQPSCPLCRNSVCEFEMKDVI